MPGLLLEREGLLCKCLCCVLYLLQGYGSVIQMYPGTGPVRAATDCFGFPKSFYKSLYEFPLSKVESLMSGTFSGHTGVDTVLDAVRIDEESNGSGTEKQEPAGDVSEDSSSAPESAMDSSQQESLEEMEACAETNTEKGQISQKEQIVSINLHYVKVDLHQASPPPQRYSGTQPPPA